MKATAAPAAGSAQTGRGLGSFHPRRRFGLRQASRTGEDTFAV
ncbi:hypothetical protein KNP414_07936 [Paenibacillus mucilaginosus KNP414]|uniref:Uncharacterized protein n=1 Tax=Paenibacillus mucilaginosus (strain KNP414) TaxID=1036673 RepID=F8FKQ3_PAEMK|nr:hypothetical protein KNP414_07936 [Paenibacillus mucilaginosus KNP414]